MALVVSLASGLAVLMRKLRQPLIVSYLLAGALLSVFHIVKPDQLAFFSFLPEIGLAFLLFLVGMELDLGEFRHLGKNVLIVAFSQVAISTVVFLFLLGRGWVPALALSFSSTVLVVKLLLEEKELGSLHGKLAMGILLVEDLVAILAIMFLTAAQFDGWILVKGIFLIWLALISGKKVLPRIFKVTAESTELLFLTAIGWCLLFVSLSLWLGVSLGIGAFLAGVSLAQSVYRQQISGRIKPLRDFFIMLFFIDLGAGLSLGVTDQSLAIALVILGYVVIIKPLIIFIILTTLRFRVNTAFQTAVVLSSVSEFSLIIIAGNQSIFLAPVVLACVGSFIISAFLVTHRRPVYRGLKGVLKKLEKPGAVSVGYFPRQQDFKNHAILIGCHRSGEVILKALRKIYGDNLLVVDFNPEVIEKLKNEFVPCLYGDVSDPEIAEMLNFKEAKMVVSTMRDLADNLMLLDGLEKAQSKATIIITASDTKEAITLYERGAHHVSLPMMLEGNSISQLINQHKETLGELMTEKERKLGDLKRMSSP